MNARYTACGLPLPLYIISLEKDEKRKREKNQKQRLRRFIPWFSSLLSRFISLFQYSFLLLNYSETVFQTRVTDVFTEIFPIT